MYIKKVPKHMFSLLFQYITCLHSYLTQFKIRCNLCLFFPPNLYSKISEFTKTKVFSQSGPGGMNSMYDFGKRSIIYLNFSFTPSLTSSINLSYYSLYKNKSLSTKNLHKFYKNIAQQIEFKRLVFAMAVLQAPFSLTQ